MSTPSVSVAIQTLDLTSPGFNSATLNAERFKASIEGSTYSMREAQGAARLFNEELGTHMSRHLTAVLAQSALLGPALELAFPIAAAVGFYEVVSKVGEKLGQWYFDTAGLDAFKERMDETTKSVTKLWAETLHLQEEASLVGASPQQKWALQLDTDTASVDRQRKSVDELTNKIYFLKHGLSENIGGNTAADVPDLERMHLKAVGELSDAAAKQSVDRANLTNARECGDG